MDLNINGIRGAGDLAHERLVLEVQSDLDIGDYIICACPIIDQKDIEADIKLAYWCETKNVFAGDLVIVYTKVGVSKEKPRADGTKTHFFYWDRSKSIWNDKDLAVVLLHCDSWTTLAMPPEADTSED
jgi:hypothetical protein